MRILHINCNYTGTTLHQLLIEKLDQLGHKNQVFVPMYDKTLSVINPNNNVLVCECFKKWDRLFFGYKQKKIIRAVESNLKVCDYDLIHAYTLFTDGNCARYLAKKYNKSYVVAVRNTDVNSFFKYRPHLRSLGIRIMRDAKAVFFLSESYRNEVFDKYVPKKYKEELLNKTVIIPNGIDDFWLNKTPQEAKKCTNYEMIELAYAGRIEKNKNIPTTQKAMAILRNKGLNTHLTVVGKIQDQAEYKKISADEFTTCLPAMCRDELIYVYRRAHIFVMPSYTESFGLVYAEAMSQGLPVIYSKGQGFDGQFDEGVAGYSVLSSSPDSVAEGIIKVLENYEEISKNAPINASVFNWYEISKKYDKIYKEL